MPQKANVRAYALQQPSQPPACVPMVEPVLNLRFDSNFTEIDSSGMPNCYGINWCLSDKIHDQAIKLCLMEEISNSSVLHSFDLEVYLSGILVYSYPKTTFRGNAQNAYELPNHKWGLSEGGATIRDTVNCYLIPFSTHKTINGNWYGEATAGAKIGTAQIVAGFEVREPPWIIPDDFTTTDMTCVFASLTGGTVTFSPETNVDLTIGQTRGVPNPVPLSVGFADTSPCSVYIATANSNAVTSLATDYAKLLPFNLHAKVTSVTAPV